MMMLCAEQLTSKSKLTTIRIAYFPLHVATASTYNSVKTQTRFRDTAIILVKETEASANNIRP